ncbi:MAG: aminoglycoside 6'-N-acetyltransferase [Burkholderiaceae bacterium]|nr:aminoglycoside 6'-N-acetyltransferase [Burkholderiaceae bacterium]
MADAAAAPTRIEVISHKHLAQWLPLRHALWPDTARAEHASEAAAILRSGEMAAFVAMTDEAVGFAEASLRRDHVNGCDSPMGTPVAFLEGLYVIPAQRRRGIARALCNAVAEWGRAKGGRELASDTALDNLESQAMHQALGFAETERVVFFRRALK